MTRWTSLLVLLALGGLMTASAPAADAAVRPHVVSGWWGYADTDSGGHTYSKVSAVWTQPAINCTTGSPSGAFWVGLDGYTSNTVEQIGTAAECNSGQPLYYTWYQMYPNAPVLGGTTVKPGDKITVSVTKTGSSAYALKLTDATTSGDNISATATCAPATCVDSSAEWVAELYPTTAFTTWKVTNATVTSGTTQGVISTFPHARMGAPATGPLNAKGNGFKVT